MRLFFSCCLIHLPLILANLAGGYLYARDADVEKTQGRTVYLKQCAGCHGKDGSGVQTKYPEPLIGDLSLKELAKFIEETMPSENPELCQGKEAEVVAQYLYDEFYSVFAQVRNAPPTIDLSRLTNRQYRNSVADLIGSFTTNRTDDGRRGLAAEYFNTRRTSRNNRTVERIDAQIDFRFGAENGAIAAASEEKKREIEKKLAEEAKKNEENKEEKKKDEHPEFTMIWNGSIYAPVTGEYEIIFETENAGKLWLNDPREALIDAKVRSGDQTEHKASIVLIGGRFYPFRLEYYNAKNEPTGYVRLKWQPPSEIEQVIPERYLSPVRFQPVLVVDTPFPPDDRSVGYERGTTISAEWDQATTLAALEVAGKVESHLVPLAGLGKDSSQHEQLLKTFCVRFVERAFRRPLTDEQRQLFVDRHFEEASNSNLAVKRVVILALKSPRFLFPGAADEQFDDYRTAAWLALVMWDSIPDRLLLEAAAKGELSTRDQLEGQAHRMMSDSRSHAKMRLFFEHWMSFDRIHGLEKEEELYPEFDEQVALDLKTSLELFIEDVVWGESSDFRELFLSREMYLNDRLAEYYRSELPEGLEFQKVSLEPDVRAGILTHPYLMAGYAYNDASSPIHRGVFLTRNVLGRFLKPPPIAVAPTPVDLDSNMTTRERVRLQTRETLCMSCHGMINQLGFSLEQFDAVGRYRKQERGRDVDASGLYIKRSGEEVRFSGARELAEFLIDSDDARGAFVENMFQYLVKQPVQAFGLDKLAELREDFVSDNYHIRNLYTTIAVDSALTAKKIASEPKQTATSE